jgi:hypothetical protein
MTRTGQLKKSANLISIGKNTKNILCGSTPF